MTGSGVGGGVHGDRGTGGGGGRGGWREGAGRLRRSIQFDEFAFDLSKSCPSSFLTVKHGA